MPCIGSVTDPGFGERFVRTALDAYGGLDIIVNNAGFTWDSVIQKMTDEQFEAIIDVHVKAPFRILRAAAEPIRRFAKAEAEAGQEVFRKVVNISSVSGLGGNPGQVNYAAAKAAVVGMTKTLAKEWGRYRVNVNCVAFGFIHTRMTQALSADERTRRRLADARSGTASSRRCSRRWRSSRSRSDGSALPKRRRTASISSARRNRTTSRVRS